jgi:hypothetical protein
LDAILPLITLDYAVERNSEIHTQENVRQKDEGKKMKRRAFSCRHLFALPELV